MRSHSIDLLLMVDSSAKIEVEVVHMHTLRPPSMVLHVLVRHTFLLDPAHSTPVEQRQEPQHYGHSRTCPDLACNVVAVEDDPSEDPVVGNTRVVADVMDAHNGHCSVPATLQWRG